MLQSSVSGPKAAEKAGGRSQSSGHGTAAETARHIRADFDLAMPVSRHLKISGINMRVDVRQTPLSAKRLVTAGWWAWPELTGTRLNRRKTDRT